MNLKAFLISFIITLWQDLPNVNENFCFCSEEKADLKTLFGYFVFKGNDLNRGYWDFFLKLIECEKEDMFI